MSGSVKRKCCCGGPCAGCIDTFNANVCSVFVTFSNVTPACCPAQRTAFTALRGYKFTSATLSGSLTITRAPEVNACSWNTNGVAAGIAFPQVEYGSDLGGACTGTSTAWNSQWYISVAFTTFGGVPGIMATIIADSAFLAFSGGGPSFLGFYPITGPFDCGGTITINNGDGGVAHPCGSGGSMTIQFCA